MRNPRYTEYGSVAMEMDDGSIFYASPDDIEPLGRDLYVRAMAGDFGDVVAFQQSADELREQAKATGEAYADTGILVPFRSEDAIALLQVKAAFELGASNTVIHFSNGSKLPMIAADFPAFAVWFVGRRNSFYQE